MALNRVLGMMTIGFILFTFCTGVWSFESRCSSSSIQVLTRFTDTQQLPRKSFVHATCSFRAKCDADVGIYRQKYISSNVPSSGKSWHESPLSGAYWYKRGLFYHHWCTQRQVGEWTYYNCYMNISSLSAVYVSRYFCVIMDKYDHDIYMEQQLFLLTLRSFTSFPVPKCYAPSAQNISIRSTRFTNGSVQVTLMWNESIKETNRDYCNGSREWRVLVQSFSTVSDTPVDGSVEVFGGEWVNVTGSKTQFLFSQLLGNATYYQFLVRNQATKSNMRTFGSYIYYFGRQSAPVIQSQQVQSLVLSQSQSFTLPCIGTGFPSPNVWWISSSQQRIAQMYGESSSSLELNDVTLDHKGTYFCIATNVIVNPPDGKRPRHRVWQVNVDVKDYNTSNTGITCSAASLLSNDFYCKDYIHFQFSIYSNLSVSTNSLMGRVGTSMTMIQQYIKDTRCLSFAKSLLCHTLYPYCDVHQSSTPIPRSICMTSCTEFVNGKCKVYADALKSNVPQLYGLLTSRCKASLVGNAPECIPISYDSSKKGEVPTFLDTGSCMRGKGRGYSGNQIYTKSNYLCQFWSLQLPHKHPMIPSIYASELQGAGNSCRNPGGLGLKPWCYTTNSTVRWEYCDVPLCDSCERYNGTMCSKVSGYLGGRVFIRRGQSINSWMDIESRLSQIFLQTRYHQRPSKGCQQLLEVLLCHRVFPLCHERKPTTTCGEDCKILRSIQLFCPRVYGEYMSFVTINQNATFLGKMDCNSLTCMDTSVQSLSNETHSANNTYTCYNDNGRLYQGNVSFTENSLKCLHWNQSHTSLIVDSTHYIELQNASNHCRNPGGLLDRPWCLTNTTKGWDYCAIDFCFPGSNRVIPNDVPSKSNGVQTTDGGRSAVFTPLTYAFLFALLVFFVAIIVASVAIVLIRRRKQKIKMEPSPEMSKSNVLKETSFVVNSDYFQTTANNSVRQIPEGFRMLESSQIKYVSQLGQGNFGIVFKGQAFNILSEKEETEVAVKSLKEESSSEIVSNFIDEAKLMFTFDHPNILRIYGVCMTEMPYQMVMEYMDGGDLTQFLRARASSTQRRIVNPYIYRSRTESSYSNDPPSLNKTQLLFICKQIADGMKYLASQNHVHRDLACRNCLIKSDLTVKIGDFGMSRNLYSREYYRVKGQAILPVRWMPPEALVYGTFSVEGDVWSFGVVMWEVFSFALQPYYGRTNEEVTEAIRHGKILNRPDDCPNETYSLMKECWNMEPKSRPTFEELFSELCYLHKCSEMDCKSEASDDLSYNSDDSDAFLSEENNSLPEGLILT